MLSMIMKDPISFCCGFEMIDQIVCGKRTIRLSAKAIVER